MKELKGLCYDEIVCSQSDGAVCWSGLGPLWLLQHYQATAAQSGSAALQHYYRGGEDKENTKLCFLLPH